ncbi:hypothetical protein, partial [Klebsiella pneumoniae]|uniref:hypothetical protein n=1 Tax=Klebsiella pneumoniae TaxID=573 RepID=UPI003EE2A3CD
QSERLARLDDEADIAKRDRSIGVGEPNMAELDPSFGIDEFQGPRLVDLGLGNVEYLAVNALASRFDLSDCLFGRA